MQATTDIKTSPFSTHRVAAVTLVSLALALYSLNFDHKQIARFDAMSPADLLAYEHQLHSHSVESIFITSIVFGFLYLGAIEGVTKILRRLTRAK